MTTSALEFIQNNTHGGKPAAWTHYGVSGEPGNGPYFELWLTIDGDRITAANYQTPGCPSSMAVGAALCQLLLRCTPAKAKLIDPNDILVILGGLPEGKGHIPNQATEALHKALEEQHGI